MFKAKQTEDGVSPVIGVILLVAVTVALVALATVIVFDIGSDVSDTADATVQVEQEGNTTVGTVVRNENVASFNLSDGADSPIDDAEFGPDAGDFGELDFETDSGTDDDNETVDRTVSVIAELEDGSTEVLTTSEYNGAE